jgi:DNA-binding MarR family transcriptional regulator
MSSFDPERVSQAAAACLCLQSRMAARALTRRYGAALKPIGLEATEFSLLAALAARSAASAAELAGCMTFERTTLVRNLSRLAERGLATPVKQPPGRGAAYRLTPSGEAMLHRAIPLWRAVEQEVIAALGGPAAVEAVRGALGALRAAAGDPPVG